MPVAGVAAAPVGRVVPVINQMGGQFRRQSAFHEGLLQVRQESSDAQHGQRQ